jgi:hypothetical protein
MFVIERLKSQSMLYCFEKLLSIVLFFSFVNENFTVQSPEKKAQPRYRLTCCNFRILLYRELEIVLLFLSFEAIITERLKLMCVSV